MQEKHQAKKKKTFYLAFVDLQIPFDRYDGKWWDGQCRKTEWNCGWWRRWGRCMVRQGCGEDRAWNQSQPQGEGGCASGLSTESSAIVLDVVMKVAQGRLSWELLYADDLICMATEREEPSRKLAEWRVSLVSKGLKVDGRREDKSDGQRRWQRPLEEWRQGLVRGHVESGARGWPLTHSSLRRAWSGSRGTVGEGLLLQINLHSRWHLLLGPSVKGREAGDDGRGDKCAVVRHVDAAPSFLTPHHPHVSHGLGRHVTDHVTIGLASVSRYMAWLRATGAYWGLSETNWGLDTRIIF